MIWPIIRCKGNKKKQITKHFCKKNGGLHRRRVNHQVQNYNILL